MPDLTIEYMQQCTRVRCESEKWKAQGGCWPYKKSSVGYEHGQCKHMCGWHELLGDLIQTVGEKIQHRCPRCGGRTETVGVAV